MPSIKRLLWIALLICSTLFCLFVIRLMADPATRAEPLSNSRYGSTALWGRFAFFLLIQIGWLYASMAFLLEDKSTFVVACFATFLIVYIALTPTLDGGHMLAANGLMLLLYGYYAYRLYDVQSFWFLLHLSMPIVIILSLVSLSQFNFGMIQKATILYLVATVLIDNAILCGISIGHFDGFQRKEPNKKTIKVRIRSPRVMFRKRRDQQLESSIS
ncbi:MAG: hypothetical protein U0798_20630 [Gemmataceae bacterium]